MQVNFFTEKIKALLFIAKIAACGLEQTEIYLSCKCTKTTASAPQQWPETDERIDNIGRNRTYDDLGHYNAPERATSDEKQKEVSMSHYDKQREQEEAKRIMEQREKQEASRVALTHKYERLIIGKRKSGNCVIDVYRVIDAYGIQCPAIAHALKKLLCTGTRGHKDYAQDLVEAIKSIEEALALFVDKNSSDHTQPKTAP